MSLNTYIYILLYNVVLKKIFNYLLMHDDCLFFFFFCAADVCWAIVVSELIRAMRIIDGRQTDKTIRYSPQDLIDFSDKDKRRTEQKSGHYC